MKRGRDGRRRGDLAYARVVARLLLRGYEPRLEVEGLGRAGAASSSRTTPSSRYAGRVPLRFSPDARFELGLDVCAPERAGAARRCALAGAARRPAAGSPARRACSRCTTSTRVRVVCDEPLPLQADGEDLGDVTEAVFEAERDAISVLVA